MKLNLADNFPVDLDRLLASRLLVQARSGAGKSWLLRLLLELALKHVQCIVIDPEGEFATLREAFDVLLCAPTGADLEATPRTAATLARRLLETRASAVIDIYDLEKHLREDFVRRFCEALINAPKDEKRLALIVVDEAHLFVPEGDRSECGRAVVDVATRGRKRGLCLCLATQRLSKLNKDAAAELGNKLIGGTNLDLDVKRAADELGKGAKEILPILRDLQPGEFFGYGPAFPPGVVRFKAAEVKTTHPQPGKRTEAPREPSAKIRKLLAEELKDLPRQAETQAKTEEDLRAENRSLRAKLAHAEKSAPLDGRVPKDVLNRAVKQAEAIARQAGHQEAWDEARRRGIFLGPRDLKVLREGAERLLELLSERTAQVDKAYAKPADDLSPLKVNLSRWINPDVGDVARKEGPFPVVPASESVHAFPVSMEGTIPGPQQAILDAICKLNAFGLPQVPRAVLAVYCRVSPLSSGFQNNLGALRTAGLINYPAGGLVVLTDDGRSRARRPDGHATLEQLQESWVAMVTEPQGRILRALIASYPGKVSRDALANRVNVSSASSGFQNNLGHLRTLGAIDYPQTGTVVATSLLFPEGLA